MKTGRNKAACITILPAIIIAVSFSSCMRIIDDVKVENGVLDLRGYSSLSDEVIDLTGDFAFFWNEFTGADTISEYTVENAETFIFVPAYWEPHVRGYGIYSLKILLPENLPEHLGIKMANVLEAYSLYANGRLIHQVGTPGITKETSARESAPALILLPSDSDYIDLTFQVSVWNDVAGGLSRNISFGDMKSLNRIREQRLALDALIIGAILLIGLYHLLIFGMLQSGKHRISYLFLGFVFILIVLFIGSKDELLFKTLFDSFGSAIRSKFIYSTLVVSVPFFYCYIYFIFPEYLSKKVFRIVLLVSSSAWLTIMFTPDSFFTKLLVPLEVFSLIVSIHVMMHLLMYFFRERRSLLLAFFTGYLLLVTGVIFSMLDNYMLVPAWSPGVWFLIFGVYQTVVQAYNTSKAHNQVARLNRAFIEMEKESEKLHDLSYVDSLTSLANRRYLDEYMHTLWDRNSMTAVSIGIIIVDIDFFKLYNDRYGHLAGDDVLVGVAASLADSLNRKGDFIARYGGEEFVAVISKCTDSELYEIADRMRNNVEKLGIEHIDSACSEYVTISCGVASVIPVKEKNWLSLFQKADDALYSSKHEGRNMVSILQDKPSGR